MESLATEPTLLKDGNQRQRHIMEVGIKDMLDLFMKCIIKLS